MSITLNQAFKIQRGEVDFNISELRGAIRAFYIELGFPERKLSIPKGQTAQSWMDKLAMCIQATEKNIETLTFLRSKD